MPDGSTPATIRRLPTRLSTSCSNWLESPRTARATLRFDSDAMGVLESNWVTPTKVRQLSVTGEHGMLIVDYLTQDLCLFEHPSKPTEWDALAGMRGGGEGDMIRFALQRREPLRVQWEWFLDAVYSRTEPPVGIRDGIAALSTARSIRTASSFRPSVSSMSAAERMAPIGLATFFPASGGAEPCTGSNIDVRPG